MSDQEETGGTVVETTVTEADGFRLTERTMSVEQASKQFAEEFRLVSQYIGTLKHRALCRVLRQFMKIPLIEVKQNELQSLDEQKLLLSLIKLQDTKILILEALDEGTPK